eukprot:8455687-Alexandrium_andersonii.AAC.1
MRDAYASAVLSTTERVRRAIQPRAAQHDVECNTAGAHVCRWSPFHTAGRLMHPEGDDPMFFELTAVPH